MMKTLDKSLAIFSENEEYLFEATQYVTPIISHGKGSFIWDVDGNRYLDLNSGQFCVSFGHDYEPFNKVVNEQIHKIYHTNTMTLTPEVLIGVRKMAQINSGNLKKTIFLSTGSEANECAIRYAKFITGKNKIVSLDKGYHGLTLASQSATMGGLWSRPRVEGSLYVKTPDTWYRPSGVSEEDYIQDCVRDLEDTLSEHEGTVAAMIMEPIIGVGGMIILPNDYIKEVRRLCSKFGVILIFDECQTGFGRTGNWFAYQGYEVIPDIVTAAKAMGLGLAVSSVTFADELASKIEGKITHFSSHQNDPLSARITSFVIDEIEEKQFLSLISEKGEYLLSGLKLIATTSKLLVNPRGIGLMCAFDLPDELVGNDRTLTKELTQLMQEEGVMIQAIRQGVTYRVMPNFMIGESEINYFLGCLERCISVLGKKYR